MARAPSKRGLGAEKNLDIPQGLRLRLDQARQNTKQNNQVSQRSWGPRPVHASQPSAKDYLVTFPPCLKIRYNKQINIKPNQQQILNQIVLHPLKLQIDSSNSILTVQRHMTIFRLLTETYCLTIVSSRDMSYNDGVVAC